MGRLAATVAIMAIFAACASAPPIPQSWSDLTRMQLRQRAGLYSTDFDVQGTSHAPQLARLEAWAAKEGIIIAPAAIGSKNLLGHVSYSAYAGWIVLIRRDLSANAKLHTLLH